MGTPMTADQILDFAINGEEKAYQFYTYWSENAERPWIRRIFEDFANEELGHKEKLLAVKKGQKFAPSEEQIKNLYLAEQAEDVLPDKDMDYKAALTLAMKNEKDAFRLYSNLAAVTDDKNLRSLLLALAQEEAKHKLRFEIEYEEKFPS